MGIEGSALAAASREGELRTVGIVMNGVTGRMGTNQHLVRSILAIRADGGVRGPGGVTIWPEPLLVGRSEAKLRALAERHGLERWSADLDEALADPACESSTVCAEAPVTPPVEEIASAAVKANEGASRKDLGV